MSVAMVLPAFDRSVTSTYAPPGAFRREPALDGLRGIAILAVMLFHFTMFEQSGWRPYRLALTLAGAGWVGVDLFFALSGFLITGILLDTKDHPHFLRNFYARRALRIVPLYYAVLAVVMVWLGLTLAARSPEQRQLFHQQLWLWSYASNIGDALAGQWIFNAGGVALNHFWSLAVEEQFYLLWPAVVLLLSRRALAGCAVAIAVGAPLLRAAMTAWGVPALTVYSFTPCRLDALALGGLVAIVVRERDLLPRALRLASVIGLGALTSLGWLVWIEHGLPWLDPLVDVVGLSSLAVLGSVMLLRLAVRPEGRLTRPLRHPFLVFLGKYSYAVYVFHYLLWPTLEHTLPAPRIAAATGSELVGLAGHVVVGIALSMAAAFASFHLLERHFLALRRWFAYATTSAAPVS